MRRGKRFLWLPMALLCACSPKEKTEAQDEAAGQWPVETASLELPLPEVPHELTVPAERAAYIMEHFWDGMDFKDTLRSRNPDLMEVNFVNFLSLFPHAAEDALPYSVGRLLERSSADSTAFRIIASLAETYLYDSDSPMRNEEYYMLFLEESLRRPGFSEADRLRPAGQLQMLRKNRPGTVATDFAYITPEGERRTLHATKSERLLLFFYDPECGHCWEVVKTLRDNASLNRLIDNKELVLLAVCMGSNRALYNDTSSALPRNWIVGMDDSHLMERSLYDFSFMPALYLLDKDKVVLLRNPDPARLQACLAL